MTKGKLKIFTEALQAKGWTVAPESPTRQVLTKGEVLWVLSKTGFWYGPFRKTNYKPGVKQFHSVYRAGEVIDADEAAEKAEMLDTTMIFWNK